MQQYYIIKYSSTSKNSLAFESINLLPEDKSTYTPVGITGEVAFWCKDNNGQRYYLKPLNGLALEKVYYHTSNIQISGINELVMSPIYDLILNNKQHTVASKAILVCDSDGLLYTASKELESYSHIDNPEVLEKIQLKNEEKINLIEAKIAVLKNLLNILKSTKKTYVHDIIKHPQIGWWNVVYEYIIEAINFVLKSLFKIHRYDKTKLDPKYNKYQDFTIENVEQEIVKKTNRIQKLKNGWKWWNMKYMLHAAIVSACCGKKDFLNNIGLSGNPNEKCHVVTIDHGMTQGCGINHLFDVIRNIEFLNKFSEKCLEEVLPQETDTDIEQIIIQLQEAITDIIEKYKSVKQRCEEEIYEQIKVLRVVSDNDQEANEAQKLALSNLEYFNNQMVILNKILDDYKKQENDQKQLNEVLGYSHDKLPRMKIWLKTLQTPLYMGSNKLTWRTFENKIQYASQNKIKELISASLDQSNVKNQSPSLVR